MKRQTKKMRKRIISMLTVLALGTTLLAGCGNGGSEKNAKAENGEGDKVTIRILTRIAGTSKQTQIYNEILDEFKEKHPEVEWKVIIGMRHVLVHDYYQISDEMVWATIQTELLPLKEKVELYKRKLE